MSFDRQTGLLEADGLHAVLGEIPVENGCEAALHRVDGDIETGLRGVLVCRFYISGIGKQDAPVMSDKNITVLEVESCDVSLAYAEGDDRAVDILRQRGLYL